MWKTELSCLPHLETMNVLQLLWKVGSCRVVPRRLTEECGLIEGWVKRDVIESCESRLLNFHCEHLIWEINKFYKSGFDLLFFCLSLLNKVMEKMLIQIKLKSSFCVHILHEETFKNLTTTLLVVWVLGKSILGVGIVGEK